ncbi:unnamed protein product [Moneuplotes crassus]|uniref:Uncharacterized protein n=1 Tax=Euplotes crassus TaxID=5936 RepID=A0AAD1Y2I1_EUPCR|nr:unnamed protein product [Moneuplotes crassus]
MYLAYFIKILILEILFLTCLTTNTVKGTCGGAFDLSSRNDISSYNRKRRLTTTASSTYSQVSGTGIGEAILFLNLNVTVQAKDSSGTNLTTGGDYFLFNVFNQCQIITFGQCEMNADASDMQLSPNSLWMTDNGDGTYSAQYTASLSGNATVLIYLLQSEAAHAEIYRGVAFGTANTTIESWSQINKQIADISTVYGDTKGISMSIYFRVIGPHNETIDFQVQSEDGVDVEIDDTNQINKLGETCSPCLYNFSLSMTDDSFIKFKINYKKKTGSADVQLLWKSTTLGATYVLVPTEYIYKQEMVRNTTYNCEIKCPPYHSETHPDHTGECYEICGDGSRVGTEICDDNNTLSGDGCDKTCRSIEQGYVCERMGGTFSSDKCVLCKYGYEVNDLQNKCVQTKLDYVSDLLGFLPFLFIIVDFALNLLYILANKASVNSLFIMINFCQMCSILVLFDASLNYKILQFLQKLSMLLFHFGGISRGPFASSIPGCNQYTRKYYFCLTTQLIDFNSRSAWTMLFYHFLFFMMILIFHGIVACQYYKKKIEKDEQKEKEIDLNTYEKWFKLTSFSMYYPIFKPLFMAMVISSFVEVCSTFLWDGVNFGSFLFAFAVWIGCSAVVGISGWQFFKSQYNFTFQRMIYFRQLFNCLKVNWPSRAHPFLFFARIYSFVITIVIGNFGGQNIMIYIILIQCSYIAYLAVVRPFYHNKYNIILVINELAFVVLLCMTLRSRIKTGLAQSVEGMFIIIILAPLGASVVVSLGAIILMMLRRSYDKVLDKRALQRQKAHQNPDLAKVRKNIFDNQIEVSKVSESSISENDLQSENQAKKFLNTDKRFVQYNHKPLRSQNTQKSEKRVVKMVRYPKPPARYDLGSYD